MNSSGKFNILKCQPHVIVHKYRDMSLNFYISRCISMDVMGAHKGS